MQFKHIIAVSSGKGGVGKSTVSSNLALALQQTGAEVGLMDGDIIGPNIPQMLGIDRLPPSIDDTIHPARAYGIRVMSMGFLINPDQAMIWRGPMLHGALRQFFNDIQWGALDYMIVDLPPGTSDAQLSLSQIVSLTGAIIVTQPQEVALDDARRGLVMFEQMNVPIIGVVENMSGEFFGEGGGQRLAAERKVPFLGSIPLDSKVRIGGDNGRPILISEPDSLAAQALRAVARKVIERVTELGRQDDNIIPLTTLE